MKYSFLLGAVCLALPLLHTTLPGTTDDSLSVPRPNSVMSYTRHGAAAASSVTFDPALRPFYHGVASGDPLADRVVLWTRVTPDSEGPVDVGWRIATDTALANVVNSGVVTTDAQRDYTVLVDAAGLQPGTTYYYGFTALGRASLTGRTKTAPAGPVSRLRFGVASCANYQQGYFNAYATMAERNDLDAVIFLGDYIYEYEEGGYGYSEEVGRGHEPDNETVTLDDYRIRHSFYRLDPDLRRLHQQFPFIAVWDDHEAANDSYRDGAQNHQPATEGDWDTRKSNATQAYMEWMPVRPEDPGHPRRIFRSFSYGSLADVIMLDTRLEGRDKQLDSLTGPGVADTSRTLLGREQFDWFLAHLSGSDARWKIIGNQVMIAPVIGIANPDAWDGYPVERDRILAHLEQHDVDNVVFVTGDIHSSWGAELPRHPFDTLKYDPVTGEGSLAVEFVTPSISSANLNEILNKPPRNSQSIGTEQLAMSFNRHFKYVELDSHGYLVLDVDSNRVQSDWFYADTILIARPVEHFAAAFTAEAGAPYLRVDDTPAPDKERMLPAPLYPPAVSTGITPAALAGPAIFIGVYPNPFATSTLVNYVLHTPAHIRVSIHDTQGKQIAVLLDGNQPQGVYALRFDGSTLAAGSYLCTVTCNGTSLTRTLVKE